MVFWTARIRVESRRRAAIAAVAPVSEQQSSQKTATSIIRAIYPTQQYKKKELERKKNKKFSFIHRPIRPRKKKNNSKSSSSSHSWKVLRWFVGDFVLCECCFGVCSCGWQNVILLCVSVTTAEPLGVRKRPTTHVQERKESICYYSVIPPNQRIKRYTT
jgi:hypothetical protein